MLSLKKILKANDFRKGHKVQSEKQIEKLQLKMLRIQQGTFHQGHRAIILFEGFDAAGKGGVIRTLTAKLDPRSFRVHPIGPPNLKSKESIIFIASGPTFPPLGSLQCLIVAGMDVS